MIKQALVFFGCLFAFFAALSGWAQSTGGKGGTGVKAPDPVLVDQAFLKGNTLEGLLSQKVTKIIDTHISRPDLYRVSVNITMTRHELPPPPEARKPAQTVPDLPVADANLFDVQKLVDHYESEMERLKTSERPINISMRSDSAAVDQNAYYEVSNAKVLVGIDDHVPAATVTSVAKELQDALGPIFDKRLTLQVQATKLTPSFWTLLNEWIYKFELLVIAMGVGLLFLTGILLHKIVASWQARWPKRSEISQNRNSTNQNAEGEGGEKKDDKAKDDPVLTVSQKGDGEDLEARHRLEQIQSLENQIAAFSKANPAIPHALAQEWSGSEDGIDKLAMLLETLAKQQVPIERVEVRGDVLKKLRGGRPAGTTATPEQRRDGLQEIYWNLISMAFVGEELAVSPFLFVESVNNETLVELLSREGIEAQAAVLMSLNEKRASKLLTLFDPSAREALLAQICSNQALSPEAMTELIERLREAINEHLATHDRRLESASSGVSALGPILKLMDFATEFAAASGLMAIDRGLRASLEANYFNVALLPDAKPEFLSGVFLDRSPDWIESVVSLYPASFKALVVGLLPPMQQRMLEGNSGVSVSKAVATAALKELNDDILGRLSRNELTLGDIFSSDSDEGVNPEGETTVETVVAA